jgi:transposase
LGCKWSQVRILSPRPSRPPDSHANFLFVGSDEAGEHLAGLYSLIATCEANGVNPVAYLADVLIRVQSHPAARIDELLPHNWSPPQPEPST